LVVAGALVVLSDEDRAEHDQQQQEAQADHRVRVEAGTTVSWKWAGRNTHSVVGTFDGTA